LPAGFRIVGKELPTPTLKPRTPGSPGIREEKPGFVEDLLSPVLGTAGDRTVLGRAIYGPEKVSQPLARGEQAGLPETEGYNLPLVKPEEFLPKGRDIGGGVLGVASEFARGGLRIAGEMTTPESAIQLAGIGVLSKTSPIVSRLIAGGFSLQMLNGVYENSEPFRQAIKAGDYMTASKIAGQMAAELGMAVLTGKHAMRKPGPMPGEAVNKVMKTGEFAEKPLPVEGAPEIFPPTETSNVIARNLPGLEEFEKAPPAPIETPSPVEPIPVAPAVALVKPRKSKVSTTKRPGEAAKVEAAPVIKRPAEIAPPELQLAYSKLPEGYKIVEPFSLLPGEEKIKPDLTKTVEKPAESAKLEITEEPTYVRNPPNLWMESSIEGKSTESTTHAAGETAALPSTTKGLGETVGGKGNRRRAIPDEIESRVPAIIENWVSDPTPLYNLISGSQKQINDACQTRTGKTWNRIVEAAFKEVERSENFEVKEVAIGRIPQEEEIKTVFPSVGKQEMSGPATILYDRFQSGIIRPGEYSIKGKPGLIESVELTGDWVYVSLKNEALPKRKIPERMSLVPIQKNVEVIVTNYDRVPPEMAKAWLEGGTEFPMAKERPGEAGLVRLGGPQGPRTGDLFTMPDSPREKPTWLQFWNKLVRANKDKFVDIKRAVARLEGERGLRQIELSADVDPYKVFRTVYGGSIQGKIEIAKYDLGEIARSAEKTGMGEQVTQYLTAKGQWERSYNVTLEHIRDWKKGLADKKAELKGLKNSIKTMTEMHVQNWTARHVAQMRALKAEAMKLVREIRDQSRLLNRLIGEVREGAVIPKDASGQRRNAATLNREMQQFESRLSPEQLNQVKAQADRVFDFNEKILLLERDSGLISQEAFQKFSGRGREYIPSYREAGWTMRDETLKGTGMNPQDVEDLLLAGLKNTKDPWEASLQKAANVIQSAERNRATLRLIDYLIDKAAPGDPLSPRLLGKDDLPSHGAGAVSYFADGKKYRYEVSVELANAVNVVNPEVLEFLGKTWYRCITQMTRLGYTGLNFGFMMKNAPRDIRRMMIVSKAGVNKPLDIPIIIGQWVKSIGEQITRSPKYREAMEAGAFYGTMQRMISGQEISPVLRSKIKNPFRGISEISNLIEQATKLTTYKRARTMGMTPAEAAWETRNFGGSPDFASRGVHNQLYDLMTLFLNARIEGKASDFEAIRRDPMRTLVKWMVIGTAAELALQAYNCQFRRTDGSWEVDHISATDSVNYNVFILPWMETTRQGLQRWASVKVAKSEYEQMLMNPIQNLARGLFGGKVDGPQTALDFAVSALPLSSDVDKDHWFRDLLLGGMGVMNPVLKEPIEQFSNLDFHRKVPIVPKSEQMRSAELQYGKSTAEVWKKVGALTGTSPRRWQHAARIFGEPAEILTDVSEWAIGGKKPEARNIPLLSGLKRVVRGSEVDKIAVENTEKFYDLLERSNKTRGDLRLFKETGAREKMSRQLNDQESRQLLRLNGMLNRVARQLAELRDQRDLIERRVEEPKRRQKLLTGNYQTTQSLIERVLKFAHQP